MAAIAQIGGEIISSNVLMEQCVRKSLSRMKPNLFLIKSMPTRTIRPWVQVGAHIEAGTPLTEGPLEIQKNY